MILCFIGRPNNARIWHMAVFKWVQVPGHRSDTPTRHKNTSGPVGIPSKGRLRHQAINLAPPRWVRISRDEEWVRLARKPWLLGVLGSLVKQFRPTEIPQKHNQFRPRPKTVGQKSKSLNIYVTWRTLAEGDSRVPFSIATRLRCWRGL